MISANTHSDLPFLAVEELSTFRPWMESEPSEAFVEEASTCFTANLKTPETGSAYPPEFSSISTTLPQFETPAAKTLCNQSLVEETTDVEDMLNPTQAPQATQQLSQVLSQRYGVIGQSQYSQRIGGIGQSQQVGGPNKAAVFDPINELI